MAARVPRTVAVSGPKKYRDPLRKPRSEGSGRRRLLTLLDQDPVDYGVNQWHDRNLELYAALVSRGLWDPEVVSERTHQFLTGALINDGNPAATDPQNASHVRAQNENILYYGLSLGVSRPILTIALTAGFIHDLNKAVGEPIRKDRFGVIRAGGGWLDRFETVAQNVGLNHLGERTRQSLAGALDLGAGALHRAAAEQIDQTIIHHGIGSSRFIRRLLEGDNAWWGAEFVDPEGGRKLLHPPQPPLSLASVIHDLADSTQQMQGGLPWLAKYPEGFWSDSGLSFWEMLSSEGDPERRGIPMSLRQQIEVETDTCRGIIADARAGQLLDKRQATVLLRALSAAARRSLHWVEDRTSALTDPGAATVYHDVGAALGLTPTQAVEHLRETRPGTPIAAPTTAALWRSARELDLERTSSLVRLIDQAARTNLF